MSTATMEMTDRLVKEIQAFRMPEIRRGVTVLHYKSGIRGGPEPGVGVVTKVNNNSVHIVMYETGLRFEAVRHIDDPRLRLNAEQREMGAWDFTDEHKRVAQIETELLSRIDNLEKCIFADRKKSQVMQPHMIEFNALKTRARKLGVENTNRMKKPELQEAIRKAETALVAVDGQGSQIVE